MNKPTPYKYRLVYFLLFVAVFIVGFPILVFYSAGYKFDPTFGLTIRGGIYVFTPEPGTSVFVSNEFKGTTGFLNDEVFLNDVKPGSYLVLATNEAFWPWAKFVSVSRGEVEALHPLLVPKVIESVSIKRTDPVFREISILFVAKATTTQATTTPTTTSIRRQTKIWRDNTRVYAQWQGNEESAPKYLCSPVDEAPEAILPTVQDEIEIRRCGEPILVFDSSVPIRSADFFPSRNDAIILALDNGVYAVEIDKREPQNFYPLFRGTSPDFRISRGDVYVKDDESLVRLNLDI